MMTETTKTTMAGAVEAKATTSRNGNCGGGKIDGSGMVAAADAARVGGGNSSDGVDTGTGEHRQQRQQREQGQQREPGQQRELAS
jgi:hypothetical protein